MTYKTQLKKRVLAGLLAGTALWIGMPAALAASGAVPNTQLPQGGNIIAGTGTIGTPENGQLTITQSSQNAVIQWGSGFNVGANATVNFEGSANGYNTLNYDASGNMSQIYGAINANNNGNIYIVNPAGVEISSSAQINVGSLYVSNKNLEFALNGIMDKTNPDINAIMSGGTTTDAALMSLGNINADHVTFDGGRIVIDTERLKTGDAKMAAGDINVRTTDAGQVVLGYDAYDADKKTYAGANNSTDVLAIVNDTELKKADGYMWVEDIEQLQAVNTNLSGQYALRNSIDATATRDWNDQNTATDVKEGFASITDVKEGFASIGNTTDAFTGKFDGLDYNIFNLNINRNTEGNVGLFSMVGNGAVIRNVTLVGGSITGGSNVGALAGQVQDGAQISNIMNSASVTGSSGVGGIIGSAGDADFENLVNTGTVQGASSVGGLIGSLTGGKLSGTSYNLGGVTGSGANVGGLVGTASGAVLGDGENLIYNRLNVSGKYNVGGIVGSMTNTTVQNAENSGNVTAAGYTTGTYTYHTAHYDGGTKTEYVYIANAGGIAGKSDSTSDSTEENKNKSKIENVQNSGDVSSGTEKENGYTYYTAGNVGGIAGYFSGNGTITTGINSGGDILATGARNDRGFVKEWVRAEDTGGEEAIIGNMGGIAGYLDGDDVYIVSSANRGTVHSQDITGSTVSPVSQAANAGGIVGKIDRDAQNSIDNIKNGTETAAVKDSYNTGDVRGYMGVGGVAGMMYNGAISGSYNLGTVNTTRNAASFGSGNYYAVNMGGIVGDTTEGTNASAVLYDVYNKGQIGDETFNYYARHVGGIVGRLSGTVEKAYNTGAIYNGYNVVGGIAGWMYKGSITNSFNTGNITVENRESTAAGIQVGGIAGGASTGNVQISNVYNLGTIRGFQSSTANGYAVGGIVGAFIGNGNATISNAYTTGNLYLNTGGNSSVSGLGSIYGTNGNYGNQSITTQNTYYIRPADESFTDLYEENSYYYKYDNSNKAIEYDNRHNSSEWNFNFSSQDGGNVTIDSGEDWRIYNGVSLPILNAFLPNTENYFSTPENMSGIASIQYGTAYDPLLTIINAEEETTNLTFNWQELGASNAAGIAVYGANLTLNDFMATGGSGYFGGLIYSDGALSINAHTSGNTHDSTNTDVTGNVALGSASQLYGSSVSISADGNVTIYGDVTATGNTQDGTTRKEGHYSTKDYLETEGSISVTGGSISVTGGSVDVYGQLTSAKEGETTKVPGINGMSDTWTPGTVGDSSAAMTDIGDRFGYTTGASTATGNISITAEKKENTSEDGHVNVYYGHQKEGFLDTAGNITVKAFGDVYMDSDLSVGGDLSITAGNDSEAVLDISNIGQVQAANGTGNTSAVAYLHDFLTYFATNQITLSGGKQKIAVDMWTDNAFDLDKFDWTDENNKLYTLAERISALKLSDGENSLSSQDHTYIWVSTGEELKNIQTYYSENKGSTNILRYNFALKNDIDANMVENYVAIGTGSAFTGTFDGRGNRIIGLNVTGSNAGIFDTIGADGKVEDLRVYSGTFSGTDNAGAVAGINKGTISGVTTFGNVVTAQGSAPVNPGDTTSSTQLDGKYVGAAGGIAGVNAGTISNASASDAVTAADDEASDSDILSTAGGIAGINQKDAEISDSSSNSAVNASAESTYGLGGVAGVNEGTLSNVDSLGVTTGIYKGTSTRYSDNVGGIAGRNSGTVSEAYNESIVSGHDNVGGILGVNTGKSVENVSNAARVTGEAASGDTSDYVGGLVGSNSGSITNGRNNGEITGSQYVGGLVGNNESGSTLSDLVNDEAASITGDNYVGGIAGRNYGTISANDKGLVNRGSITGQMYVGGVAGVNTGTIANTNNNVELHVKNKNETAQYFGGVAGLNNVTGTITNATNYADVEADDASYVGGVVGKNDGILSGMNGNYGNVSGKNYVGGVAGENSQKLSGVTAVNQGNVTAVAGGAGGIFAVNNGEISDSKLTSSGKVTGTAEDETSGTGGIFGVNSGNITGSVLENKGYKDENGDFHDSLVTGKSNTGGLIGINSGNVSTFSLKNEANITVEGDNVSNIGGLIGVNTGDITGGRDKNDGYYKNQIYNNGTITVTGTGKNIGGLFGTNEADVTAAYNTGAIDAAYSENVGGIAGTNTGTLDQVFNTVITGVNADGSNVYGSITGGTSVGGIVGSNGASGGIVGSDTGIVSNAYNTTDVIGKAENAVVGAIAGTNNSTVSNVYGTGVANLVGDGTDATNVYNSSDKNFGTNGSVIDTTGESSASTVLWRQYGDKNPLLKVFLTTVNYDALQNDQNLVYNGKDQTLDVTGNGFAAADDFAAHNNVSGGLIYHDVVDVDGGHKNAGTYTDNLWSEQIKAGGTDGTFNPNNLGYDVQSVEYTIDKAQINIQLDTVDRVYGNTTPIENHGYGFSYGFSSNVYEDAKDTLREELKGNLTLGTVTADKDGALKDGGQKTSDAGNYTWEGTVTLADSLSNNYEFVLSGSQQGTVGEGNTSITTTGDSNVKKATINVDLIDVNRTYGNAAIIHGGYGVTNIAGVTNGDGYTADNFTVAVAAGADGALTGSETGRVTNDAGEYTYTGTVTSNNTNLNKNYNIVVNGSNNNIGTGQSTVSKATITVGLNDVERVYGSKDLSDEYEYGIKNVNGNTNGDNYGIGEFEFQLGKDNALAGDTEGRVTQNVGEEYTYTGTVTSSNTNLNKNYNIVVDENTGKSKVNKADLTIMIGNVETTYGTAFDKGSYGYTFGEGDVVNNDTVDSLKAEINAITGGYHNGGEGVAPKETNDAGTYELTFENNLAEMGSTLQNYNITSVKNGTATVSKAAIKVSADDYQIYVGAPEPNYTGTKIEDLLVNGDSLDTPYKYGPQNPVDTSQTGSAVIGIHFSNGFYYAAGGDWSKAWSGFKNYDITFTPGTLTIKDLPSGMPDISDSERWNTLLRDAPWDRNGNFRERKAEVHFLAGGMTL